MKSFGVRDLAFVREIDPGAAEDMRHLRVEDRRVGVDQPMHAVFLHQLVPVVKGALPAREGICIRSNVVIAESSGSLPCRSFRQKKSKYSSCSHCVVASLAWSMPLSLA